MSRVNINFLVYNNTYIWMDAVGITPLDKQITSLSLFMDKMLATQYIKILATTNKGKAAMVFVVSNTNSFSTKKDIERITQQIPMDGSVDVTIIAKSIWEPPIKCSFIQSIEHWRLRVDARTHVCVPPCVIVPPEMVMWDNFITNEGNIIDNSKILSTDPSVRWIGAKKGDCIQFTSPSSGIIDTSNVRIVV